MITGKRSRWLIEVIAAARRRLGFDVVDNEVFFQLVAARLVEPTSVADAGRVQLRPLRTFTIAINGAVQDFPPQISAGEQEILTRLGFESGHYAKCPNSGHIDCGGVHPPPAGHARWSLRLLEKHVALVDDIPTWTTRPSAEC